MLELSTDRIRGAFNDWQMPPSGQLKIKRWMVINLGIRCLSIRWGAQIVIRKSWFKRGNKILFSSRRRKRLPFQLSYKKRVKWPLPLIVFPRRITRVDVDGGRWISQRLAPMGFRSSCWAIMSYYLLDIARACLLSSSSAVAPSARHSINTESVSISQIN